MGQAYAEVRGQRLGFPVAALQLFALLRSGTGRRWACPTGEARFRAYGSEEATMTVGRDSLTSMRRSETFAPTGGVR